MNGKLAVGQVIINRSIHYKKTINEIIFDKQGTFYTFSPVGDGSFYNKPLRQDSIDAATQLLNGYTYKKAENSLWFCATYLYNRSTTVWHKTAVNSGKIKIISEEGGHIFFAPNT